MIMQTREPLLTTAICECYFNPAGGGILPADMLGYWCRALEQSIFYVKSELFREVLLPAWHRLGRPHTYVRLTTEESNNLAGSAARSAAGQRSANLARRSGAPLPAELLADAELARFCQLAERLPAAERIRWAVFSIELSNGTNFCLLADPETRTLELVSAVCSRMESSQLDEIVDVASWFSLFLLHRLVKVRNIFKQRVPPQHCTLLSMLYVKLRCDERNSAAEANSKTTPDAVLGFLNSFYSQPGFLYRQAEARRKLNAAQQASAGDAYNYVLEQCRLAADRGKSHVDLPDAVLRPDVQSYLQNTIGLVVCASEKRPLYCRIRWDA